MAVIADSEIARAAAAAGFPDRELTTAVAVALAESGGDTLALNDREPDGSVSHGLWQINSVHKTLLASGDWRSPSDNARMAFTVWQRQGWQGWGAFNDGRYLLYRVRAQAAVSGVDGGGQPIVSIPGSGFVERLTDGHTWVRVGTILLGVILLGILAVRVLGPQVADVIPTKRIAKVAEGMLK